MHHKILPRLGSQAAGTPSMNCFLLTGSNSTRDVETGSKLGANFVMLKVANPQQFADQLSEICNAEMNKPQQDKLG